MHVWITATTYYSSIFLPLVPDAHCGCSVHQLHSVHHTRTSSSPLSLPEREGNNNWRWIAVRWTSLRATQWRQVMIFAIRRCSPDATGLVAASIGLDGTQRCAHRDAFFPLPPTANDPPLPWCNVATKKRQSEMSSRTAS